MGILEAWHYPTVLFAKAADHTYVQCSTGAQGWKCWGGKVGGTKLRSAPGSTIRADAIAEPDEKANIRCYLINGVCHQAANRILLPAGILVSGARGYSVSHALFGTYGRVGIWPCRSSFNKFPGSSGDLSACVPPPITAGGTQNLNVASDRDQLDWNYIREELAIYERYDSLFDANGTPGSAPLPFFTIRSTVEEFHISLYAHMIEFYLGPRLTDNLRVALLDIRRQTESARIDAEQLYATNEMDGKDFVERFNKITLDFQSRNAEVLSEENYQTLFRLPSSERVVLADPDIAREVFNL